MTVWSLAKTPYFSGRLTDGGQLEAKHCELLDIPALLLPPTYLCVSMEDGIYSYLWLPCSLEYSTHLYLKKHVPPVV